MEFYSKYELIDPLPGEGTRSFRARQIRTGREVAVHLLPGGKSPENEALLARLRALPPRSMAQLLEVGDNEGTPYVVTEAPPYLHLVEWLAEQERAARADAAQYTRAGMWKIPVPPPANAAVPPPADAAGEFTGIFGPTEPVAAPGPDPAPEPPAARHPEELVATMEIPSMRKAFLDATAPPPAAAPPAPMPTPAVQPAAEPGEFTRLFQAPLSRAPAPGDPPAQAPAAPEPGDFTRMFQAGPGGAAGQGANPVPPAPRQENEPGEFTRFFQSPGPAGTPAVVPSPPFGSAAPPPSSAQPGGFTQMFGKPGAMPPGPVAIPPAAPPGGNATQAFSVPPQPAGLSLRGGAPQAPPVAPGPSEYTRMISLGGAGAPAGPGAAPPPPAVSGGGAPAFQMLPTLAAPRMPALPQMPQMPPAPPVPQFQVPQPPPAQMPPLKAPSSNTLVIAIGCVLAFIAGIVVVLLVMRK